jgi:hypothetical protein
MSIQNREAKQFAQERKSGHNTFLGSVMTNKYIVSINSELGRKEVERERVPSKRVPPHLTQEELGR